MPSGKSPLTVCIVEDNHGTRDSLVAVLQHEPGLRCLATYATGEAALAGIPAEKPDVALVDINLPGMNGIELVAKLKLKLPELPMLILTSYEESGLIFDALRAGASGYLLKKTIPEELIPAIEQVRTGGAPMSAQVARKVVGYFRQIEKPAASTHSDVQKLTAREQEILSLLAKGYLIKEISDRLGIAFHTARTHLRHIYEKLHVQSRTGAVLKFLGRDPS
ncbi:MAG TPA: response regulator transcription factor [Opitutaceae bacterium]|jgi:DNA-binding NarL/FixJ family response regulator|nr:response regulator transcription factor [Opitutaceae bacterium]